MLPLPTVERSATAKMEDVESPSDDKIYPASAKSLDCDPKQAETTSCSSAAACKHKLPLKWQVLMIVLTCLCTFGNHWSNGLIVALKTTIIKETHINNSQFATLVAITNLINTFLCIGFGFCIDKWGGAPLSVIFAAFHLAGSIVMAGAATNNLNSYHVLIAGKVIAAIGDGSLDNAQHRIFSTYFAPGRGFAFSIGAIWGIANLAQFTGQSTANIITKQLGSYSYALWISAGIAAFSFLCAVAVVVLDRYLRRCYMVTDQTSGKRHTGQTKGPAFTLKAIRHFPMTFWIVVAFAVFENAGVQSFVSISTQFAQQRLKKGAVIAGWVSSFYLLLPACLTPFLGIYIDSFGQRIGFLFASGLTFLTSMLLLRFSTTVPTFIAAYVFYALSQSVTPAPQVEIVRNIIPNPQHYATGFAIKKSVVQASIVIITTAAGKLQDDSPTDSLEPAVTLWLAYAFISVAIAGALFVASYVTPTLLPAARLAQINPRRVPVESERLAEKKGIAVEKEDLGDEVSVAKEAERRVKAPASSLAWARWTCLVAGAVIIVVGWVIFGLGVSWGVHGSVIAGTVGE
ncbi:MFS general substrate transporter [Laetiporus sulphureus 93-53]|uniref:Lysosomal dipeptide transporter MFSD1 n=1 Tax=Laetiporus sulphureus 93-53 TaxID=1314785 RepID=A0A165CQM5_9APHY|nr:MFS general substrate transporter [Laetiporus sulphureus 93-53]KZT03245.1 MFS general substrate transporter [Laetiporus sulphureus 93-53]